MSTVDDLPPDQRAALSVLLRQRKTYAQVAEMLGIPEHAVHDRAHSALAVLAPREARALDQAARAEIGDYLLGQQHSVGERLRTRTLLANSGAAAGWAHALSAKLDPLAPGSLPEIPAPGQGPPAPGQGPPAPAPTPAPAPAQAPYPLSQAAQAPPGPPPERAASSRRGGAILLALIVIAAVVAIVIVNTKGSSSGNGKSTSSSTKSSTTTTGPKTEARFPLHSPDPRSRSTGSVEILSEGGKRAFYIQAEHIPASKGFFYAVWLYNSHTSALPLSKAPPVGSTHKLAGAALLPEDAGDYKEILLTRETSTRPTHPGHVVLRGAFKLP